MKGIIFNELEKMVTETAGEDAWERLVEQTPLETEQGVFIAPKTYPDSDFLALVGAAGRSLSIPLDQLIPAFGRYIFPHLAERFPVFLEPEMTAKSFLMTVEETIHLEVKKLYPDAVLPRFEFIDTGADRLEITYSSPRRLCALVGGLIEGVGKHFGEQIETEHDRCVHRGDDTCHFNLAFRPAAGN